MTGHCGTDLFKPLFERMSLAKLCQIVGEVAHQRRRVDLAKHRRHLAHGDRAMAEPFQNESELRQFPGPADGLVEHADLSSLATFHCNDMVVDAEGRAYVGNFGSDLAAGGMPDPAALILVAPDGNCRVGEWRE